MISTLPNTTQKENTEATVLEKYSKQLRSPLSDPPPLASPYGTVFLKPACSGAFFKACASLMLHEGTLLVGCLPQPLQINLTCR